MDMAQIGTEWPDFGLVGLNLTALSRRLMSLEKYMGSPYECMPHKMMTT